MRSPVRPLHALLLVLATSALVGCPSTAQPQTASGHASSGWVGAEATLFDDGIDVGAVPLDGDVEPPRDEQSDAMIAARVKHADGIDVAKVIGVTREPDGNRSRYVVELAPEGKQLAGEAPPATLVLRIGTDSPAFGTVRAREQVLVGRRLVVYYRRYAPPEGEDRPVLHFHLSPAIPALLDDIHKNKTVDQF